MSGRLSFKAIKLWEPNRLLWIILFPARKTRCTWVFLSAFPQSWLCVFLFLKFLYNDTNTPPPFDDKLCVFASGDVFIFLVRTCTLQVCAINSNAHKRNFLFEYIINAARQEEHDVFLMFFFLFLFSFLRKINPQDPFIFPQNRIMMDLVQGWGFTMCC